MPRKKQKEESYDEMSVDELMESWRQIKDLLNSLEDDYRNAEVSEDSYKEAKEKNTSKLNKLTEILKGWGITEDQLEGGAAAPAAKEASSETEAAPESGGEPEEAEEPEEATKTPEARPAGKGKSGAKPSGEPSVQAETSSVSAAVPAAAGISMEVIDTKMDAKMEKLKANLEAVKETGTSLSERMQTLAESIGELKSQGAHREGVLGDLQSKFDTLEEQVKEINPQKFTRELEKRDKTADQQDMRIERTETKTGQIAQTVGEIKKLLESVGGLENVAAVSRQVGEKMNQVNQRYKDLSQLGSKIEKMYTELNRRMEDFAVYKSKQENLEALSKDMLRSIDTISTRLDDFVNLENFDELKKNISDIDIKIGSLKDMIGKLIPIARMKIPQPIMDLQEEQEAIKTLLSSIESEYEAGNIEKGKFDAVRVKNITKLSSIQDKIKSEWQRFEKMVVGSSRTEESAANTEAAGKKTETETPEKTEALAAEEPPEENENSREQAKPGAKGPGKKKQEAAPEPEKDNENKKSGNEAKEKEPLMTDKMKKVMKTGSMEGLSEENVADEQKTKSADKEKKKTKIKTKKEQKEEKPRPEKESMLEVLEDSYKNGLISKEAYERTRKMLEQ